MKLNTEKVLDCFYTMFLNKRANLKCHNRVYISANESVPTTDLSYFKIMFIKHLSTNERVRSISAMLKQCSLNTYRPMRAYVQCSSSAILK